MLTSAASSLKPRRGEAKLCRPYGARSFFSANPALTRWANFATRLRRWIMEGLHSSTGGKSGTGRSACAPEFSRAGGGASTPARATPARVRGPRRLRSTTTFLRSAQPRAAVPHECGRPRKAAERIRRPHGQMIEVRKIHKCLVSEWRGRVFDENSLDQHGGGNILGVLRLRLGLPQSGLPRRSLRMTEG